MKLKYIVFLMAIFVIMSCSSNNNDNLADENTEMKDVDIDSDSVKVDVDSDKDADVEVKTDGENTEIIVDDSHMPEMEKNENYCVAGSTYVYDSSEGSVDSLVIGLETYKGKEFCKAKSETVIENPAGEITTETIYYFDSDYDEYWIKTTISSPIMPAPQVTEIHLIGGEVQN
jgi:hypothetical protein